MIQRSINRFIWATEDVERIPFLDLELVFDDGISLFPSEKTINNTFHNFINAMANIAQQLTSLEQWVDKVPVKSNFIKVSHIYIEYFKNLSNPI